MAMSVYDIPPEVLEQIIVELEPEDVAQLSLTSSLFASLIYDPNNQLLWRKLYLAQFLDDPRICIGPLGEPASQEIDWKKSLQNVTRARAVVRNPGVCLEEEREEVIRTLLHLATHLPPNHDINDADMSRNLAWLADVLRGGSFFDIPFWPLSPTERELRAQLHTYFGVTTHDFRAKRRVESRGFVYAMRNYKEENSYGPFVADGSGRVSWEHMLYIQHVMSMHILPQGVPERTDVFTIFPLSLPYCQSIVPMGLDLDTEEDWAGVEGDWHCSFAFCDHRELLVYNNYNISEEAPLRTEIFEDPLFTEVFRTMHVKIKMHSTEPDPDHPTRPKILWSGTISGTHVMTGSVRVTPDNHIRWHFESGEPGFAMWSSEGVQIGGVRSPFGIMGTWTTVTHDLHDPIGPFLLRKLQPGTPEHHEDEIQDQDQDQEDDEEE